MHEGGGLALTSGARSLRSLVLGKHSDACVRAGAVRQHHRTAHLLITAAWVHAQVDCNLQALIKLGLRLLLQAYDSAVRCQPSPLPSCAPMQHRPGIHSRAALITALLPVAQDKARQRVSCAVIHEHPFFMAFKMHSLAGRP